MSKKLVSEAELLVGRQAIMDYLQITSINTLNAYREKGAPVYKPRRLLFAYRCELDDWIKKH